LRVAWDGSRVGRWRPVDRAAGGLITSVAGLLAWARFQLDGTVADGSTLLSAESRALLQAPVVRLDRWTGIALDWFVMSSDGGTTVSHGGLTVGYCGTLVLAPQANVAVVSLTHATNGAAVNQAVRRWALERYAAIAERDPTPDPAVVIDTVRFEGRFLYPFGQLTISAGVRPNTLRVTSSQRDDVDAWKPQPDPPMTLAFVDDHHAVTLDAPGPQRCSQFGFDHQGRAAWLTWESRRALRNG
jgi:hypothetical protein